MQGNGGRSLKGPTGGLSRRRLAGSSTCNKLTVMKICRLATSAFLLSLVVSDAHAEVLNPAARLPVERARLREAAAQFVAQNSLGKVNDLQNREIDASETITPTAS